MGLIYSSTESAELIEAFTSNLASAKEVMVQLKAGSQKIVDAVDGEDLSGAAYTAGKGLFSELILPTINRVTTVHDTVSQELKTYQVADELIADEGYLDEDNLKEQIQTKKMMQNAVEFAADAAAVAARTSIVAAALDAHTDYRKKLDLLSYAFQQDIRELERKSNKLYTFEQQTHALFTNSLKELNVAMQAVTVLNQTTVNSDGTYTLPEGVNKSWFTELKSKEKIKEMEEKTKNEAIKKLNDLFEKNPEQAIKMVREDERLFGYVIGALDKFPKKIQDAALAIFIAQESWSNLPKKTALKVLNNPKFASYLDKVPYASQAVVYVALVKFNEKGWDVLAPIGYATNVLSKTSEGAKLIAGTKVGFEVFKKLKTVAKFVKNSKVAIEATGPIGDSFSVATYAYEEYINPKSPAYGNVSKAVYGGVNLFMWNAGPLEGVQYGGPIGAVAGGLNTVSKMGKDWINSIPKIWGDKDGFGWSTSKENQRKWLDKEYKKYGKHEAVPTDKEYHIGVQPQSGSPNFNPNIKK
ncbi:T7SS effector LXG polymorphic toxin [Listeria seeligeri]|uniref:T7SS effector LXG polymorphic toxin n=1 Tax=Listeria seeligeri TaxID=1640 RepID=UPI0018B070F4|nr:T7SS effector LXG polymorphic toxin [Listeria seeligeri]QPJ26874.1 hypothetical protein IMX23_01570 [Listeria seeligeri]